MRGEIISVFFLLMLIPFAVSYDLNGDGIDDGEQMMCGDTFCQPGENATNCPTDCVNPSTPSSGDLTNITTENETLSETNETIPTTEENLPSENENSFFASTTFKIILLALGLIVIGLIIFLMIRKKKNQEEVSQNQTTEVAVSQ